MMYNCLFKFESNQIFGSKVIRKGHLIELCHDSRENLFSGFPTRFDTNRAVQPQKVARGLKFWI